MLPPIAPGRADDFFRDVERRWGRDPCSKGDNRPLLGRRRASHRARYARCFVAAPSLASRAADLVEACWADGSIPKKGYLPDTP